MKRPLRSSSSRLCFALMLSGLVATTAGPYAFAKKKKDSETAAPVPPDAAAPQVAAPTVPAAPADPTVPATVPADLAAPPEEDVGPGPDNNGDAFADTGEVTAFTFKTLLQARYTRTFADRDSLTHAGSLDSIGQPTDATTAMLRATEEEGTLRDSDGYRINRAFFRVVAKPTKHVEGRLLIDAAELMRKNTRRALKLAYGVMTPHSRVTVTAGLFKRQFSLLELLPIADYELGDVGPTDAFIKDLGFGGRDIGAMVRVAPLPKKKLLYLYFAAFAGDVTEGLDASPGKLITTRGVLNLLKQRLAIGADFAWRPTANTVHDFKKPDSTFKRDDLGEGWATSGDVTVTLPRLMFRGEVLYGQRTDVLTRGDARTFLGTWALAAYRIPFGDMAILPALRIEWLDVDRENPNNERLFLTAGLNLDFTANTRVLIDFSHQIAGGKTQSFDEVPWRPNGANFRPRTVNYNALIVQLQTRM